MKKQICIFQKFSYLGDNLNKSSSDVDNIKQNASECKLKVKTIKINGHELTTDKGICKFFWNGICKKDKNVNICTNANVLSCT